MNNEWLGEILDKVNGATKLTTRTVNYVYNIKKLELEITKINYEIGKIYSAIGKLVYNARNEEDDSSNIEILCKQIDVKRACIEELQKRIEEYKKQKSLEKVSFDTLDETPKFIKDELSKKEEIAIKKLCSKCGKPNDIENEICISCGEPFPIRNIEE